MLVTWYKPGKYLQYYVMHHLLVVSSDTINHKRLDQQLSYVILYTVTLILDFNINYAFFGNGFWFNSETIYSNN